MNVPGNFFDDVVTMASVMLFAKFVTHRTRSDFTARANTWHMVCVSCCVSAIVLAFAGVVIGSSWALGLLLVGSTLAMLLALAILLWDVLVDDRKQVADSGEQADDNPTHSGAS